MASSMGRKRFHNGNRRAKSQANAVATAAAANSIRNATPQDIYEQCEAIKQTVLTLPLGTPEAWFYRQQLLDSYQYLIMIDLDFALEKKIEHDLWGVVFKNEMNYKQEQLKDGDRYSTKRIELQASLQTLYEYARGYYMKLLPDVIHGYNFPNSICKLNLMFIPRTNNKTTTINRQCKEASMVYFIQHILVHVGDLNRYSNQIDLAKNFYHYAIRTIPYLGQPYNQIAILHEMKNPSSLLTPAQNQLITAYYYVRSIAIKVTFPMAITNLEKFFTRLKDFPLTRYTTIQENEKDFITLFLQIIAMINLEYNMDNIRAYIDLLRLSMKQILSANFDQTNFIHMIAIVMFTQHRILGLLPRSSSSNKQFEFQFDLILTLFVTIIEQCLEAIQLPLTMMIIDEHYILPVLYLSFIYLSNVQKKHHSDLFEHLAFKHKQTMWMNLAKLLRSFGVYASNLDNSKDKNGSLFVKYVDYPLIEERTLECFTPLHDVFIVRNFKKYDKIMDETIDGDCLLSEKDERQLRKLRLVHLVRGLCQHMDGKNPKKIFDHLITFIKDDVVCFESTSLTIQQPLPANFGAPGDRRSVQRQSGDEHRLHNPNGNTVKTPRGARNVALRQYLEPALEAAVAASESVHASSPIDASMQRSNNASADGSTYSQGKNELPRHNIRKTSLNDTISFPPHLFGGGESGDWPTPSQQQQQQQKNDFMSTSSSEPKDLFQLRSIDYESHLNSVWSNSESLSANNSTQRFLPPTAAPHQMLAPGLMFSHPSTANHNSDVDLFHSNNNHPFLFSSTTPSFPNQNLWPRSQQSE